MAILNEDSGDALTTIDTTYSMAHGDTFFGNLSVRGDRDWVAVTLEEGIRYTFAVNGVGDTPVRDTILNLRDDTGRSVSYNDDGGPGLYSRLTFTASVDGVFYLDVGGYGNSYTGDYEITMNRIGVNLRGKYYSDNLMFGTDYDDTLIGGYGDDELTGGAGNDYLSGSYGGDIIYGGDGNDRIYGGSNNYTRYSDRDFNVLWGGEGDDLISSSGNGRDSLYGEAGNDSLTGNSGNNVLLGGDGDDRLNGGYGADTIDGGAGDDVILVSADGAADRYIGGSGSDTLSFASYYQNDLIVSLNNPDANSGLDEDDIIAGFENIEGSRYDDRLIGDSGDNRLVGNNGADRLYGLDGDDFLRGDQGGDLLYGGDGADRLEGGAGDDILRGANGNDLLLGGDGDDQLFGGAGADELRGGTGRDKIDYIASSQGLTIRLLDQANNAGAALGDQLYSIEDIRGTVYDDEIYGNSFRNILRGHNGDDDLRGYGGNDKLFGGLGDDEIIGGQGNDIMLGGGGADRFVFRADSGSDRIGDFRNNGDTLVLNDDLWNGNITSTQVINRYARADGVDAVLTFDGGETIRLVDFLEYNTVNDLVDNISII